MRTARKSLTVLVFSLSLSVGLSGCVGTIVGTAVDTTIEVIKVPFKVVGAAADIVTGSDLSESTTGAHPTIITGDSSVESEAESRGLY